MDLIKEFVECQAKDESFWGDPQTIYEAFLQQNLRKLHYVIEEASLIKLEEMIKSYK